MERNYVWECERCGSEDRLTVAGGELSCSCDREPGDDAGMYVTVGDGPRRAVADMMKGLWPS